MVQHLERVRPPGRNDPCPCGSGKKYKRCCLVHEAVVVPERHLEDVLAEAEAADQDSRAIEILLEARRSLHDTALDRALADRYLRFPADEAEQHLRTWWEQQHDRVSGTALAQVLVTTDRRVEALAVLNESQGTAEPEYWRLLARLRDDEGEIDGAVTAMELYTRLAPDDGESWLQLADLQRRGGQNDRALLSLRRAADVLPDRMLPRMLRLQILAENGRWREVRDLGESLREASFHDADPDALHDLRDVLARAYFVLGEFDAARDIWEVLLQERSEAREVRYQLAQLEMMAGRQRCALLVLDADPTARQEPRVLDLLLQCLLALHEYKEAGHIAHQIEHIDPLDRVVCLVSAAEARASKEYAWSLEMLEGEPPDRYRDLWNNLRLDCLAQLGRWQDIPPVLKTINRADDPILASAALGCLAAGKLDLAERLLDEMEDQHSATARSLSALLGPLRQLRRAAEVRRQQQVDEAEKQRRAAENRDLRRRVRDLERHNEALANALAGSEASLERLLELVGVSSAGGVPADWERQIQTISERAHKDALAEELRQAEQRLRGMLGDHYWNRLSENARVALREGEWLFAAVEGEDRDYGASLLEYARGLERAFKDAIFVPIKKAWERQPGASARLQDEGHDPSLGPFVRYLLQSTHLTLGSMAAALDRMGDARRQGVAISLLRQRVGADPRDERALEDWKRTAERLVAAANARNRPAHAASVSRESVQLFREMVLGTDGLLRALASV